MKKYYNLITYRPFIPSILLLISGRKLVVGGIPQTFASQWRCIWRPAWVTRLLFPFWEALYLCPCRLTSMEGFLLICDRENIYWPFGNYKTSFRILVSECASVTGCTTVSKACKQHSPSARAQIAILLMLRRGLVWKWSLGSYLILWLKIRVRYSVLARGLLPSIQWLIFIWAGTLLDALFSPSSGPTSTCFRVVRRLPRHGKIHHSPFLISLMDCDTEFGTCPFVSILSLTQDYLY